MAILQINVVPLGTDETSISSFVTKACRTAQDMGLQYEVNAMSTIIQGDQEQLFEAAKRMHEIPLKMGAGRVITSFTLDERIDKAVDMENMVEAVIDPME